MTFLRKAGLFGAILTLAPIAHGQVNQQGFEDYGSFVADPSDLDAEVSALFGRFFQTSIHLGTGLFAGSLGSVNAAGPFVGLRFIYYFDREFGLELGADYARHNEVYDTKNIAGTQNISITMTNQLIPISMGLRYGFDQAKLTRGFATLNPFLATNVELFFRNESVQGTPTTSGLDDTQKATFGQGAIITSTAFGIAFGGGFEFDVYKKRFYLGVDARYHLTFWPDSSSNIGQIGRDGNYITVVGTGTYNY